MIELQQAREEGELRMRAACQRIVGSGVALPYTLGEKIAFEQRWDSRVEAGRS